MRFFASANCKADGTDAGLDVHRIELEGARLIVLDRREAAAAGEDDWQKASICLLRSRSVMESAACDDSSRGGRPAFLRITWMLRSVPAA